QGFAPDRPERSDGASFRASGNIYIGILNASVQEFAATPDTAGKTDGPKDTLLIFGESRSVEI
ncbi:MAG: hypothetical protein P8Y48_18690, partial [Novosphingobium sp.]